MLHHTDPLTEPLTDSPYSEAPKPVYRVRVSLPEDREPYVVVSAKEFLLVIPAEPAADIEQRTLAVYATLSLPTEDSEPASARFLSS